MIAMCPPAHLKAGDLFYWVWNGSSPGNYSNYELFVFLSLEADIVDLHDRLSDKLACDIMTVLNTNGKVERAFVGGAPVALVKFDDQRCM